MLFFVPLPCIESQAVFCYLLCTLFAWRCASLPNTKQPCDSKLTKMMAWQLFNVAKIKYCFLSNDGDSVWFLNRFGKII